jgi:hypothetical protein
MGSGCPLLAHDPEDLEPGTVQPRPLVQEPADRLLEELIPRPPGLGRPVVNPAKGRGLQDRLGGRAIPPVERSPQLVSSTRCAPGCRRLAWPRNSTRYGRHPLVGKHQHQLPAVGLELLQPAQPSLRGGGADHLVVGAVALAQLPLDDPEGHRLIINRRHHWPHHDRGSSGLSSRPPPFPDMAESGRSPRCLAVDPLWLSSPRPAVAAAAGSRCHRQAAKPVARHWIAIAELLVALPWQPKPLLPKPCALHSVCSTTDITVAITDEASPFALRSTRNRPREQFSDAAS